MFLAISEVTKVDRQSVHDFVKYDSLKNIVSCCNTIGMGSKTTTYLESTTPICLFTMTLLLMRPLMLRWNRAKIFWVSPKMAKFWRFSGSGGQGLEKVLIFTAKGTSIRGSTSFAIFCVKNWLWGVTSRSVREKTKKVTNIVYFTYLLRSPRCSDHH